MMRSVSRGGSGRPRSAAVDEAILTAAFALFIEHGVEGASIERIARRAGVAKTSIYRRWPSREALLAQAIEAFRNAVGPTTEMVDRASPADFIKMLFDVPQIAVRPEIRNMLARLIGSLPESPLLLQVYRDTYFRPRREALIRALRRTQDVALLRPDADIELLADTLVGALLYRLLFGEDSAETFRAYLPRLLRHLGFIAASPDQAEVGTVRREARTSSPDGCRRDGRQPRT
jgi:AcrR family transcriptional regulator